MSFLKPLSLVPNIRALTLACTCLAGSAAAIDIVDEFDSPNLDTTVWESSGPKSYVIADGVLTWQADAGNWGTGELGTVDTFFLPPVGETTTIEWTLGPGQITNDTGRSIRYQVGIHSANQGGNRREHWHNSTGGLWYDIDNIANANPSTVAGNLRGANDTKEPSSNANDLGFQQINWNWQTENKVIRLDLTDTGFTWFEDGVQMLTSVWTSLELDAEFANGYRVLAIGMNFDQGRGTTSLDRVSITNAGEPPAAIKSFSSSVAEATAGDEFTLNWEVDSTAGIFIDQGVGNVDANTTDGQGQVQVTAPAVEEITIVTYLLTTTVNGERATRSVQVKVHPPLRYFTDDFFDDFDGNEINPADWESRGGRSFTVGNGNITWNGDGGDWGHGEIDSVHVFPLPPAGETTQIIWTFGTAETISAQADGNTHRPMMGIVNAREDNNWSRQHWQNDSGGIWLDLHTMGDGRKNGAAGVVVTANDTKAENTNGATLTNVDIPEWNWETDSHSFRLELTDTEFSWYDGETLLASSTYEAVGLDTEFDTGFRIMMLAGNSFDGRGIMNFDSLEVINGASGLPLLPITEVNYVGDSDSIELAWESKPGMHYVILSSPDLAADLSTWESVNVPGAEENNGVFEIPNTAPLNRHSFARPGESARFYRVQEFMRPPVAIFEEYFDSTAAGSLPAGWTTAFDPGDSEMNSVWELGDPSGGPITGPPAAFSGTNCVGINLQDKYGIGSRTWLRTPVIDLSAAIAASLTMRQWVDVDPFENLDHGTIRVVEPGTFAELGVVETHINGLHAAPDWLEFSAELPPAALGRSVIIAFGFVSDDDDLFDEAGWYIDDVTVNVPAP